MLYEDQAAHYDERASIPVDAAERTAAAVDACVNLAEGCSLLEVGVGTGLFSIHLLAYPIDYAGFDRSPAMLAEFAKKASQLERTVELHVADGNDRWPANDASVDVVFSARALHHLEPAHVASELRRVLRDDGGWLVVARVSRPKDSPKASTRRAMRRLLQNFGIDARNHERHTD